MFSVRLCVFDFDGTIFRSPENTPENHKLYEKATGTPWLIDKKTSRQLTREKGRFVSMRSGWWGRKETLEPPLVPKPAPEDWFVREVCDELHKAKGDPDTQALIVTGRHGGLRSQVLRILSEGNLVRCKQKGPEYFHHDPDVSCFFLGDDVPWSGSLPKPGSNETLPWKMWVFGRYLQAFPETEQVEIWEDRDEHLDPFRTLGPVFGVQVTIHHVKS